MFWNFWGLYLDPKKLYGLTNMHKFYELLHIMSIILSPVLFNVYLEDALNSSSILHGMRERGDLLAFADDMLIMSN